MKFLIPFCLLLVPICQGKQTILVRIQSIAILHLVNSELILHAWAIIFCVNYTVCNFPEIFVLIVSSYPLDMQRKNLILHQ